MEKTKKHKHRLFATLILLASIIIIAIIVFFIYVSIYNHGTERAVSYLNDSTLTKVTDTNDYVTFQPKKYLDENKTNEKSNDNKGIIFYPGGKVEYKAYAPILRDVADSGVSVILCKVPFNLAVLNYKVADNKQSLFNYVGKWYMAGHSLGGAMASKYLEKNYNDYSGLILMGAYSSIDLSKTNLSILSILASEDKVINKTNYENNKKYLSTDFTEKTIQGGIHSYFGDYGIQSGDGTPSITVEEQNSQVASLISEFVNK